CQGAGVSPRRGRRRFAATKAARSGAGAGLPARGRAVMAEDLRAGTGQRRGVPWNGEAWAAENQRARGCAGRAPGRGVRGRLAPAQPAPAEAAPPAPASPPEAVQAASDTPPKPTPEEDILLNALASLWQTHQDHGLSTRHMMGDLLNRRYGPPTEKQTRGKYV